jgi:hypothetical protein
MPPDHQDWHFKQLACGWTNAANPEFLELISIIGFHIGRCPSRRRLLLIFRLDILVFASFLRNN